MNYWIEHVMNWLYEVRNSNGSLYEGTKEECENWIKNKKL